MNKKAVYCREQAALARRYAAMLTGNDRLQGALERNARAFEKLAGQFDDCGRPIGEAALHSCGPALAPPFTRIEERAGASGGSPSSSVSGKRR